MVVAGTLVDRIAQQLEGHCKVEALVLGYRAAVLSGRSYGCAGSAAGDDIVSGVDIASVEDQLEVDKAEGLVVPEIAGQVGLETR